MTRKFVRRVRRGPRHDISKWADVEWVDEQAEHYRAAGRFDPVFQACVDWVLRFNERDKQTTKDIKSFRKRIKNATDDWRRISRAVEAAYELRAERTKK